MALSANAALVQVEGPHAGYPVKASTTIYASGAVGVNTSGYAEPLAPATVADLIFAGHSIEKVDNSSGAAGDKNVQVLTGTYRLQVTITSVAITDAGKPVYMTDDNTYTITAGEDRIQVGHVVRREAANKAVVEFVTDTNLAGEAFPAIVPELDCETGVDTDDHVLIPANANPNGLLILGTYGIVSEVFGGASEDQGIITINDESNNALATLTASDGGADAAGDVIIGTNAVIGGSSGDAVKTVAAGEFVDCKVTQATSGASAAGKIKVHIVAKDLLTGRVI